MTFGGLVTACVWDHAGGGGSLSTFWRAVHDTDPGARDESGLAGTREGHLAELCGSAGLQDVESTSLTVDIPFASFSDWWAPFHPRRRPSRCLRHAAARGTARAAADPMRRAAATGAVRHLRLSLVRASPAADRACRPLPARVQSRACISASHARCVTSPRRTGSRYGPTAAETSGRPDRRRRRSPVPRRTAAAPGRRAAADSTRRGCVGQPPSAPRSRGHGPARARSR